MVVFLTSSFIRYQKREEYVPSPIIEDNGFGDNLRKYWKNGSRFFFFASDPEDYEMNDHAARELREAFELSDFSLEEIRCFDNRYIENYATEHKISKEDAAHEALLHGLKWADVFYLAGGHCPTENAFMKRCGLKELIADREIFDGIFIGLSAGSVNAAGDVYLIPELEGEAVNPSFVRFSDGLGLTAINMLPHSQYEKTVIIDGLSLVNDVISIDSRGRDIYMIPDGSYFIICDGITEFYGEGVIMKNGKTRRLEQGIVNVNNVERIGLGENGQKLFDSMVGDYYDCVFELNPNSGAIVFYHISDTLVKNGIIPSDLPAFDEFCRVFSEKLVVEEEKKPFIEQLEPDVLLQELREKGSYVRTVHCEYEGRINAKSIRVNFVGNDNNGLLFCLTDISQILDHDWMTDEYSRSGFMSKAEELLAQEEYRDGYSIVYTNIQGFKAVNNLLGTFSGDMVIFMERDILVRELKPVIIGRFESDHFVLLTKTSELTAKKLDRISHQNYEEGYKELPILIRFGIFNIEGKANSVQYMVDRAKLAENSIPADHGVAYAFCDEKLSSSYVEQRRFVSELDGALARGEFKTYFQPVVDAYTGEIVSAEALIRWISPEDGMISPGRFIPVFEKEGVISKIDSFMIDHVLNINLERVRAGKKVVPCAVNLSRVDFYDTKLLDIIRQRMGQHKNVSDILKLEVTESAYAVLESNALSFLEELNRLGVSIMLDDFGSGMSSLSTLESYEFDVIKLDMGFVAQIGKLSKTEAIIKHIIGLSHDIGARVVAEGVETEEQLEFLRSVGCDMIQGYYFYKPMPEEEFTELLS